MKKIRTFNIVMGSIHLLQAVVMLFLAIFVKQIADFKPGITTTYLAYEQAINALVSTTKTLFNLPFGILVSLFLFVSAFFHFLAGVPKKVNDYYNRGLEKHINVFRWYEYALSSSIMIVLIAVLFGVYDIGTLILVFLLNASMNLFGLLMEKMNQGKEKINWLPFIFGCVSGIGGWIIVLISLLSCEDLSQIPWFVFVIAVSYFILFNLFPINMVLQYKKIGKWKDYLYGERVYIILSLVAKTLLAWLVFAGIMQP